MRTKTELTLEQTQQGVSDEVLVTSTQDDDDKRLSLVDDLKEVQVHTQVKLKKASSSLKSKDYYTYHKLKDKDSRQKAKAHGKPMREPMAGHLRGVESYQQKVNLTAPTITFLSIEKFKVFSIVFKPVYGIIYKNNKKEKRVMRHQEVHNLSNEDAEYLELFEEEIEEQFKHRDQMRR
ncbi:hypothetical protein Tco_1314483 [Tanacetum coccineum]